MEARKDVIVSPIRTLLVCIFCTDWYSGKQPDVRPCHLIVSIPEFVLRLNYKLYKSAKARIGMYVQRGHAFVFKSISWSRMLICHFHHCLQNIPVEMHYRILTITRKKRAYIHTAMLSAQNAVTKFIHFTFVLRCHDALGSTSKFIQPRWSPPKLIKRKRSTASGINAYKTRENSLCRLPGIGIRRRNVVNPANVEKLTRAVCQHDVFDNRYIVHWQIGAFKQRSVNCFNCCFHLLRI